MSRDSQALLLVCALAKHSSQSYYTPTQRIAFWRRRTSLALQRVLTRVVIYSLYCVRISSKHIFDSVTGSFKRGRVEKLNVRWLLAETGLFHWRDVMNACRWGPSGVRFIALVHHQP